MLLRWRLSRWGGVCGVLVLALIALASLGVSGSAATVAKASRLVHGGACSGVFWRSLRDGDQRCPRTHSLVSDIYWNDLRWTSWGPNSASGYGQQVHRLGVCVGQPLRCHNSYNPIWVHLYNPIRCPSGRRIYAVIDVTELSRAHRVTSFDRWPYWCQPAATTIGGGAGG